MSQKTKAQLEEELTELYSKLARLESEAITRENSTTAPSWWSQWAPAILVGAVLAGIVYFQRTSPIDPVPEPEKTIEAVTATVFPEMKSGYSETFTQAADGVKSGQIITDQQLFEFVQPALVRLRIEKQRPFDQIFQLALPRSDDGSLAGHEAEVEDFLRRIARSW